MNKLFLKGVKHGLPIGLGYLSVSFAFGMQCAEGGLSVLQALLISMTNLTSAGQFAGLTVITTGAAIIEMIFYYIGTSLSLGTILAIGLLFLLIMAIIKTGQDLFASEKKRQQAILAREAQAKFLANMSHEIRTPINAIIGMNETSGLESLSADVHSTLLETRAFNYQPRNHTPSGGGGRTPRSKNSPTI